MNHINNSDEHMNKNRNNFDNSMNEYFNNTSTLNVPQECNSGRKIELVDGSKYNKNYYNVMDESVATKAMIRYYQVAMFDEFGKYRIRSMLFEGMGSKGTCFYNYKMVEIKEYDMSLKKRDKFVDYLNEVKRNNKNLKTKIMYKFYPVYNFQYTNPPNGNELSECTSDLLI